MKRRMLAFALAAVFLQASCYLFKEDARMDLGGRWEFRRAGDPSWRRATVPGCVHTDLFAEGIIPDPYFGSNETLLQDLENHDWEYRKTFRLSRNRLAWDHFDLVFEGLDTYAAVWLNDSLLFEADNMFRRFSIPCKEALQEGRNELRVRFRSPVGAAAEPWKALGYELPGGPRVLTRKAAFHYGWDWGPRFVTCGIWRPVYLRGWNEARIVDFAVTQGAVTAERAELTALFEIEADSTRRVALTVIVDGGTAARAETDLAEGRNVVPVRFSIEAPELWWTNGLGRQRLYRIRGELRSGRFAIDGAERRIGIRTLELVEESDSIGRSFYFRLNGVPVYMKGANHVPQDVFLARVTPDRRELLVSRAAEAHMNMLRVWGGGVYEDDRFYDLCDEHGILVWQDFMFACAMYPGDWAFLRSVEREAVDNVKRLRSHPCLALWCGNNEIDEAWHHWGWQRQCCHRPADSASVWRDYERLFHEILPAVVAEHDPGRPYVASSPRFGRADPRSLAEGDCHYWGVWHDGEPFESYREKVPRFMSEFGFQSFPAFESVKRFADHYDWKIDSPGMLAHQKHPRGNELIEAYMERYYIVPESFREFTYVSQLLQAEGVREGIEAQRRAKPRCMGSLFWQLSDCWPAVSWSSIDYDGVPKALHYRARDAFAPVLVSPVVEGDTVRVWVVSDLETPLRCALDLEVMDFSGGFVWGRRIDLAIPADTSLLCFEEWLPRVLGGWDEGAVVLDAELRDERGPVARNLLYFAAPKDLDLPAVRYVSCAGLEPAADASGAGRSGSGDAGPDVFEADRARGLGTTAEVRWCLRPRGRRLAVEIESDALVKNLWLDVEGARGYFTDNYFDVVPGDRLVVEFVTDVRLRDSAFRLRLASLADIRRGEE